jgi:DNA repair protein SbcD/Mre11
MKIGVIGDVHLGYTGPASFKDPATGLNSRVQDYYNTLISTIDDMVEKGCEYICFTGDIFEHRVPSPKLQAMFSAAIHYAISRGIKKLIIIEGNHDQQRITGASTISYLQALKLPNVVVFSELDVITLEENGKPAVNIIGMPYRDRRWMNSDSNDIAIKLLDEQLAFCLSSIDNDALKVVVGHHAVEGTLEMMKIYAELYNGNDLVLPISMFNSVDITIMGHVHPPLLLSKRPFVYCIGSMEKSGAFEEHDKQYAIIDTETKKFKTFVEPCRNLFDLKIDLSERSHGHLLMEKIYQSIDNYPKQKSFENSIVKVLLSISADDENFCEPTEIETYLKTKYSVFYCAEIKPSLMFSRQARDTEINEHASDVEAFSRHLAISFKDSDIADDVLNSGIEIISSLR